MPNEYHPWTETGESELEYFRRRFLEESGRAEAGEARAAEAWRVLRNLRNQTHGALWMEPAGIEQVIGVTNFRAIELGIAEADAFLSTRMVSAIKSGQSWAPATADIRNHPDGMGSERGASE